jgi:hypothetical protein
MKPAVVEFLVTDFLDEVVAEGGIDHATTEAVCKIVDRISTECQLKYNYNYKFDSAYFDQTGKRIVKFVFFNEKDAMMTKLKGLSYDG